MECCKKVLNSAVVLPLTAGHASDRHHSSDYIRPHDGSSSGLIMLSCILVVTFVCFFGSASLEDPLSMNDNYAVFSIKHIYLCVVTLTAVITCVVLLVVNRSTALVQRKEHADNTVTIKLTFLWIFTIGSIFFSLTKVVDTLRCDRKEFKDFQNAGCINATEKYNTAHEIADVSYQLTQIIFYVTQAVFIQMFAPFRFKNSWKIYYSLLLIVLANVSQWTHSFANIFLSYGIEELHGIGILDNCTKLIISPCYPRKVLEFIKPYLQPVSMEVALLSMIFIAELWPTPSENSSKQGDWSSPPNHGEPISLMDSQEIGIQSRHRCHVSCATLFSIIIGVLLCVPCFVFEYLLARTNKNETVYIHSSSSTSSDLEIAEFVYDIFRSLILVCLIIGCFHLLSMPSYFTPTLTKQPLHFHHKLIIVSFLGSVGYFALEILSCLLVHSQNEGADLLLAKRVVKVFELYMLVVCILQFNNYKFSETSANGLKSVKYVFLVVAVMNLLLWASDSLFDEYSNDKMIIEIVYDETAEKFISHFLFPFLVFFRFKTFITFYGIYNLQPVEHTYLAYAAL